MLSWSEMLAQGERVPAAELRAREASLGPHDTINIQYTSGTTGTPKGAELSHYNVVNNGRFIGDSMKLTERDKVCIPGALLPLLWHGAGQHGLPHPRLRHGDPRRLL